MTNAAKDQFTEAEQDGCEFHSKQVWQKKMKKLSVPKEQIRNAMSNNCLGILTATPPHEARSKGMPCAKAAIESMKPSSKDMMKWEKFWIYFEKRWLSSEEFMKMWNHHGVADDEDVSNNGLER